VLRPDGAFVLMCKRDVGKALIEPEHVTGPAGVPLRSGSSGWAAAARDSIFYVVHEIV
jgi:hypothetical protein